MVEKLNIDKFLRPDKGKIAYFIIIVILINFLPLFPCHVERNIIVTQHMGPSSSTYNTQTSVIFESPEIIISKNFKWDFYEYYSNETSISEDYYCIEIYGNITCSPVLFLLLYLLYTLISYIMASWLVLIIQQCEASFEKKDTLEKPRVESQTRNPRILSDNIRNCPDCGASVYVKPDWSGICSFCKRAYMNKEDWNQRNLKTPICSSISPTVVPFDIQVDIQHWDAYQTNLDEISNDSMEFKISYALVFLTLASTLSLMTIGMILTYSKVQYTGDEDAFLTISGWGLAFHLFICMLSGFYIGKNVKKAAFAIPIILAFSFIAVFTGLTASPMIFHAALEGNFNVIYVIQISATALLSTSFGMASVSRYYYS